MYDQKKRIDFSEFPTLLWDPEYDTHPEKLEMLVQHLSDWMLIKPTYGRKSLADRQRLYNIFSGNVTDKGVKNLYKEVLTPYGAPGSATIKDYNFYYGAYQSTQGTLLRIPFKFGAVNISQSVTDKRIEKDSKMVAAMVRNNAVKQLSEAQQQDLSFMENKEVKVPSTAEQLLSQMNAPQTEEYAVTRILRNLEERHNVSDELLRTNQDHFVVNRQYAYIDTTEKGEPVPRYLNEENLSFIASKPVKDMDDPNIMAWSVRNWISFENALTKYGQQLAVSDGVNALKEMVQKLREDPDLTKKDFRYSPSRYMVNGGTFGWNYFRPLDEIVQMEDIYQADANGQSFHPFYYDIATDTALGNSCSILEQIGYFKIIRNLRAKVTIKGKNPTSKEISDWKKYPWKRRDTYRYVPVEDDYKAKDGEFIASLPKEELWEYTRLGHCVLLDIRRYRYETRYERNITRVHSPIVGMEHDGVSLTELGINLSVFYNSFMLKAEELRNQAGADDLTLLDEAQLSRSKWAQTLHGAQQTGTVWYNSTVLNDPGNDLAKKHLTKISLTPKITTILQYMDGADRTQALYTRMTGTDIDTSPYDSAEKVNQYLQKAGQVMQNYYRNDHKFRKKVVQRWADIAKIFYGQQPEHYLSITFGDGVRDRIKITKDLSLYDYEVYMQTGIKALEDHNFVMTQASAAVSAGQLGFMDLVKIYYADNVQEQVGIIQMALNNLQQQSQQQAAAANQIAAQRNQIEAQKLETPVRVAETNLEGVKYVADRRAEQHDQTQRNKEEQHDIEAQNKREEMVLQSDLDQQKQASQQQADLRKIVVDRGLEEDPPPTSGK